MKVINLPQRSPQWHRWRHGGVSASEAAIILGISPYKTPWRLWAEKTGRAKEEDLSRNPNVARGIANEDRARQCAEKQLNEDFLLPACAESDKYPHIRASYDGLTEANIPAELKCPSEKQWADVVAHGEYSESFRLYCPQVQQQILVADASYGWLLFYSPDNNGDHRIFKVLRDDTFLAELIVEIDRFWLCVEKDTPPPLDVKRDLFMPETNEDVSEWISQATDYRLLDQKIKDMEAKTQLLKEQRSKALEKMQSMMGEFYKADYAGVCITRYETQGSIDYESYLAANKTIVSADDLEKYRKNGSSRCRVTVTNKAIPKNIIDLDVKERLSGVEDGVLKSMYF